MLQTEKPQLNPHPLSPYVAWAGQRNRDAILEVFKAKLPQTKGSVLEFASGSGMHIHYFAPHFQHLNLRPSDLDDKVFDNIQRLTQETEATNVHPPIQLDLTQPETWTIAGDPIFDAIYCINLFQVAPISIADGMMQCAANLLSDRGSLLIYGPFKIDGKFTTASNEEFDSTLRSYNVPEWGLKDTADLTQAAQKNGLTLKEHIEMPANNFMLIYTRQQTSDFGLEPDLDSTQR